MSRGKALHMEIVPYCEDDRRTVYEMVAEGWHPLDIATAYGWLVHGRPLATILDSPLVSKRRHPTTPRPLAIPKLHSPERHYSFEEKEAAVWLVEHGWDMTDVAVMIGMGLDVGKLGRGWSNNAPVTIRHWCEVVQREHM